MAVDLSNPEFLASLQAKERQRSGVNKGPFVLTLIMLIAFLTPFYYLLVTVFKTTPEYAQKDVMALPDSLWPIIENTIQAWTLADMSEAMFNSLTYSIVGSALAVGLAAAAAYGLTRLNLRSANSWFMVIFAGTLFPFQMYLVPLFFGYQRLGLINSWFGMFLIYIAICIPFPLLVLRNSFAAISKEVDEAARIEGASEWRVFVSMIVPNAKGPLVALVLLQFTWIWNDLLFSSILASSTNVRSIMVALQSLQGTYAATGPNVVVTASLITSIPTVVLFVVLRKHFMSGLQLSTS